MMPLRSFASFLLLTALVAGCGEEFVATGAGGSSSSSTGGAQGGGGAGGTTTTTGPACEPIADDACNQCLLQKCETLYCACADTADCVDLGACLAKVETEADVIACWHDHEKSISLAGQIQACGSTACEVCSYGGVDTCTLCEYTKCSAQTNACFANPMCLGLADCANKCKGDPAPEMCKASCLGAFPDGTQDAQALLDCVVQHCVEPCK